VQKKSIILANGRSGTTLLMQGLGQTELNIGFEPLHTDGLYKQKNIWDKYKEFSIEFLEEYYNSLDCFKILYYQLNNRPDIVEWLKTKDCQIIFLDRQDVLGQCVSGQLAHKRGDWIVYKETNDDPIIVENPSAKINYLLNNVESYRYFENKPNIRINYEDLYYRWDTITCKIQRFIGIEPKPLKRHLIKINSKRHLAIRNWDEVYQELNNTGYEKYLYNCKYHFLNDWFSHNIPKWRRILSKEKIDNVLEVGSNEGRSAVWIEENLNPKLFTSYDPFPSERLQENLKI